MKKIIVSVYAENITEIADEIFGNGGARLEPKKVQDSINSFLEMLEPNLRKELVDNDPVNSFSPKFTNARDNSKLKNADVFKVEFKLRYHLDPMKPVDQDPMTQKEIDALNVEAKKIMSDLTFLGS